MKTILIIFVLAIIGFGGWFFVVSNDDDNFNSDNQIEENARDAGPVSDSQLSEENNDTKDSGLVACIADAMQCPDGSYVGRTGSNCEFVCPPEKYKNYQGKSEEENISESFKNTWGYVLSVEQVDENRWILGVDLLSHNPKSKWPDISNGESRWINQSTKIRNLYVTENTKVYDCTKTADSGLGANYTYNQKDKIALIEKMLAVYEAEDSPVHWKEIFDIEDTEITAIQIQCVS